MDLSIIVITHNTREMVIDCIKSVIGETKALSYEIIVLDSGSSDASVEAIRAQFPDVKLIASKENLGFATANNIAAKHARGRRLLLLNPDTVILNHAIDRLYEFAEKAPERKIWGGRTVFGDGSLNVSCRPDITLWSLFCFAVGLNVLFDPETYGRWKVDAVRSVDMVVGCFFLIDHDLWQSLGGFDPIFFMFGEEADLCIRARALGAQPTVTPDATIVHYGGGSSANKSEQLVKMLAGRVTLMQRHWSAMACLLGRWLYYMLPVTRGTLCRLTAIVSGNPALHRKADTWAEVWNKRRYWIDGWNEIALLEARKVPFEGETGLKFYWENNSRVDRIKGPPVSGSER
jgi:N-acetylglucosaminyl-diphospho-decaprenol L-rhamnosyltransferase